MQLTSKDRRRRARKDLKLERGPRVQAGRSNSRYR
jgi:hypothetical protein